MQQTATAASLQMTKHLKLFLCIDMLVWLESFRPVTSAETCVIHLVMLFSLVLDSPALRSLYRTC